MDTTSAGSTPVSLGYWQRNYRYRIARWGYSPAVLAWEVWNEHGLIDVPSDLQQFYTRLGAFVAATDPYPAPLHDVAVEPGL